MNSSRVPESPEPPKMAASSPEKGGATSCTTENPKPRESIAEAEPVSVNDVPKGPGLDHDESKSPILEAFVSQTTVPGGTDGTSKKPSPDDEHTQPTLWCRVELHDPQQWAKCVIVDNPIEKQFLHTTEAPEKNTRTNLWQYTALLKHIAKRPPVRNAPPIPHTPPVPRASTTNSSPIGYSNRFLDRNGQFLFTQSWPEALDFDLERGKAAGLMAQSHKPIIELITTVKTNIDTANKVYSDTPAILSNPSVTADYSLREVVIHSICIIEAFKATILYYPGLDLQGMELTISEPYSAFWHYHQELKAIQTTGCTFLEPPVGDKQPETTPTGSQSPNADTIQHLKLLCDLIESQNLEEVKLEQERHRQDPPVATYQMMWLLFKPGTRVYYFSDGRATAGVVVSIQTDNDPQRLGPRSLKLWSLDFDGFKLGRRALRYKFKPFDGEKRVSELHVCPCDIYDAYDNSCLRSELISRGRKFWNFLPGIQVDYEGKLPNEAMEWRGRVIIDPMTYIKYPQVGEGKNGIREELVPPVIGKVHDSMTTLGLLPSDRRIYKRDAPFDPDFDFHRDSNETDMQWLKQRLQAAQQMSPHEDGPWAEYENIIPGEIGSLELNVDGATQDRDVRYLLCPKDVIGFDLRTRRWLLVDIACCKEVKFNDDAVNNLVMSDDRKMVIKSLVQRYTITDSATPSGASRDKLSQPWTADFIKNKGDGQIFLLHGSPGVGKTYTAECIAEATRRPLLSLTCGDFGTDETNLEQMLSKWFRLAEVWGAVLLLDEADVFLERRQLNDLKRNSLVSVFLRTMEYYRGILFLTTNRVGNFDDAFISRIHTVIHYEGFTDVERKRIWEQFFKKLEIERRSTMKIDPDARKYVLHHEDMKTIQWNGREIRNAFQTAVAFAEYRFSQLTPEEKQEVGDRACLEAQDFVKVSEMTMAFKKYLRSIKRDEETVAKMGGFR